MTGPGFLQPRVARRGGGLVVQRHSYVDQDRPSDALRKGMVRLGPRVTATAASRPTSAFRAHRRADFRLSPGRRSIPRVIGVPGDRRRVEP
jgi:hypothetical protein